MPTKADNRIEISYLISVLVVYTFKILTATAGNVKAVKCSQH